MSYREVIFLFWAFSFCAMAQAQDATDSSEIQSSVMVDEGPDPRKAALYSLLLPGAGQIYNKKAWKVPIIYAALGACAYFAVDNRRTYTELSDCYDARLSGNTLDQCERFDFLSTEALRRNRDNFDRNYQTSLIFGVIAYVLNAVEAYTDAHLSQFDVEDDLSLFCGSSSQDITNQGSLAPLCVGIRWKLD